MKEKQTKKIEASIWETKKKQMILCLVIGVLVVAGAIGGILYKVYAGQGTVGGMLKIYYETMYSNNGKSFDDLCNCLAPEIRGNYYMNTTNGGTDYSQLNRWRAEAIVEVGENVKVKVEVQEKTPGEPGALGSLKQTIENAEELVDVEFHITLTGDKGYIKMKGYTACVREGDDWFLSTGTIELGIVDRNTEE